MLQSTSFGYRIWGLVVKRARVAKAMNKLIFSVTLLLMSAANPVLAQETVRKDVLLIDRIQNTNHVPVPRHGQTKEQVSSNFGEPVERHGPVGNPAISRWVYPEFTVYFENQWVLKAVINRGTDTETLAPN